LRFGRHIAVNRRQIHSIDEVNTLAALIEQEKSL
jgi:5-methylthioribose kinase